MNDRGLDRVIAAGVTEVNVVVVASDTFSLRNQGVTDGRGDRAGALRLIPRAREHGLRASLTVGAAFGCPFEGEVPLDRVLRIVDELEASPPPTRFPSPTPSASRCRPR